MSCNNVKSDTAYSSLHFAAVIVAFDFDANRQALLFFVVLLTRRNAIVRNETRKRDLCVIARMLLRFLFGEISHRQQSSRALKLSHQIDDNFCSSFLERKHLFWRNRKSRKSAFFVQFCDCWRALHNKPAIRDDEELFFSVAV